MSRLGGVVMVSIQYTFMIMIMIIARKKIWLTESYGIDLIQLYPIFKGEK